MITNSRHWSTATRLSVLIAPPLLFFIVTIVWFFPGRQRLRLLEHQVTITAQAVLTQIQMDREYYASVVVPRLLNTNAKVQADYHKLPNAFPLPATFLREVTEMIARNPGAYRTRLVSPWPINKQNGMQDAFHEKGFRFLMQAQDGLYSHKDTVSGMTVMRFLAPDKAVHQSCVDCHNAHPDSPKHDFRLHDLMGGIEVAIPIEAPLKEAKRDQLGLLLGGAGVTLVIIALIFWGAGQVMAKPIRELMHQMEDIVRAHGNVSEPAGVLLKTDTVMGRETQALWQKFWEMHESIGARQRERSAELQHQAEAMQSLNSRLLLQSEISQAIIQQAASEEEVYRMLTYGLQQVLPLRQILILRLNASEDRLELIWTSPKREDLTPDSYPVWDNPFGCPVIRTGHAYKVQNVHKGLTCASSLSNQDGVAYWCVPLLIGGRSVGVVHLVGSAPECWTDEVCAQIQTIINVATPMIAHLRHLERAKRRALTDELTGAYNRRFLEEVLAQMVLPDERRRRQTLSVLMIDLDHFKTINDTYGHPVGDLILKTVASAMHRALKDSDILVRYGGEEFTVVLPQTNAHEATVVAERLRTAVAALSLRQLAPAAPDHITISIGVAAFPAHATNADDLLREADTALYQAKALGRNRVVCAPSTPNSIPLVPPAETGT